MFRFPRRLPRVLLVLVLALGCAWAQQQPDTGNISGQIKITRGTFPDARIEVKLTSRGALVGTTFCDDEGKFAFYNLPANNYHITIDDDHFQPYEEIVSVNPLLIRTNIVTLILTPRPSDKPQADDAQVSGENPYMIDASQYKNQVPKKALKEFESGVKAQSAGKLESAIRHWQSALEVAPAFYPAHNNLGVAYLEQKNFPSAEAEFGKAITLSPNDTQAYFNLGNVMLLTGRYDDAQRVVEDGLRHGPNAAFGYFLLGTVAERRNRPADAEVDLRKALALDPLLGKVHLELVNLYLGQHHNEAAIAELQVFLQRFPTDPLAPKARDVLGKLQGAPAQP